MSSGEWLPPKKAKHSCVLPKIDWRRSAGERWRCECGKTYVVEEQSQHGESWNQFRRVEGDT